MWEEREPHKIKPQFGMTCPLSTSLCGHVVPLRVCVSVCMFWLWKKAPLGVNVSVDLQIIPPTHLPFNSVSTHYGNNNNIHTHTVKRLLMAKASDCYESQVVVDYEVYTQWWLEQLCWVLLSHSFSLSLKSALHCVILRFSSSALFCCVCVRHRVAVNRWSFFPDVVPMTWMMERS